MQATVLISGFLGAGKTTLLRELGRALARHGGMKVHAVLNDYRNAEIDAALLRETIADLAAISGSCVCCESRDELFETLATLPREEPGVVLIEANGGADPAEIVELLAWDPRCRHLAAPWVVGVIHAGRWQKRLLQRGLERAQIRPATHLILGHADAQSPPRLAEVRQSLGRLNPAAREVDATGLAAEIHALAVDLAGVEASGPMVVATTNAATAEFSTSAAAVPAPNPSLARSSHAFASVELPLPTPLSRRRLQHFLDALPPSVLRAKALVQEADSPAVLLLQRTDDGRCDWHRVEPGPGWRSSLVLIGPGLDEAGLRAHLAQCLGVAGS